MPTVPAMAPSAPVVIVLAAGLGRRFRASGGRVHKLDAPLDGQPVLWHAMRAVQAAGLDCHVVREAPGGGMGDSIAAGVRATVGAGGWLVLPGDLPLISPRSLWRVAAALAPHKAVVPYWNGRQGHPVGFGAECFGALARLEGEAGAAPVVRALRESGAVRELRLDDDPGIVLDVDTVDDLARAQALLRARGGRGLCEEIQEEAHGEH